MRASTRGHGIEGADHRACHTRSHHVCGRCTIAGNTGICPIDAFSCVAERALHHSQWHFTERVLAESIRRSQCAEPFHSGVNSDPDGIAIADANCNPNSYPNEEC